MFERELLSIQFRNGKIGSITNFDSFQTRGESTIKMVLDAINIFPATEGIRDREIFIHTSDYPRNGIQENHFYYSCDKKEDLNHVFPDCYFDAWPQIGIPSYMDLINAVYQSSQTPYISNKLFWIGNTDTHISRSRFMNIAQENPHLIDATSTYVDRNFIQNAAPVKYTSLPEHTQYKYLLDIEGIGWSARIKYLLFTNRVLFIQDRRWKQYYLWELEPYKHFIPVKNDFSDLLQQIELVEKEGWHFYQYIANNALHYAINNLQYRNAIQRIRHLISL